MNKSVSIRSSKGQKMAIQDAFKAHDWPEGVSLPSPEAADLYMKAQEHRAHVDWPHMDLVELSRVCRMIVMWNKEYDVVLDEGLLIEKPYKDGDTDGGYTVQNPRFAVISKLNGDINATLRRLGITKTSITQKRAQANRATAVREVKSKIATVDVEDEDLLN